MRYIKHGKYEVQVAVDDALVSPLIQKAIADGLYERFEADRVAKILKDGDIVLELGAGVGFISTMAAKTGKPKEIIAFEADPRLIPIIKETHRINGVQNADVRNAMVQPNPDRASAPFFVRENFWGSSANAEKGMPVIAECQVDVVDFQSLLDEYHPTVIISDIEGGEVGLFRGVSLPSVRRILMEVHQGIVGGEAMRQLFLDIHNHGFHYDQQFSQGSVVVFSRA